MYFRVFVTGVVAQVRLDEGERVEQLPSLCQVLGERRYAAGVDVSIERVIQQSGCSLAISIKRARDFGREGQHRDALGGEPLHLARDRPGSLVRSAPLESQGETDRRG